MKYDLGIYWIKPSKNGDWLLAEWDGEKFREHYGRRNSPRTRGYKEDEIFEIGEKIEVEID